MSKAVATEEKVVLVEREGALAWIKLNRPRAHNCLSREVPNQLILACEELGKDRSVRVVSIIGSGAKVFCSGADLAERKTMTEGDTLDYIALIQRSSAILVLLGERILKGPYFYIALQ